MLEIMIVAMLLTGCVTLALQFGRSRYVMVKDMLDRLFGAVVLVLFLPVIATVALLEKLTSSGPVFYRQKRVGKNGRIFWIIKFRTMRPDAESGTGPVWAKVNDDRITPLGRVLRTTYLDELPQLWNVLNGDMSLIGPRPERPYFVNRLRRMVPGYEMRMAIKPGITGLAQVRAGYDHELRDVRRKVKLDTTYIRHMCWWVDFVIILRTGLKWLRMVKSLVTGAKEPAPLDVGSGEFTPLRQNAGRAPAAAMAPPPSPQVRTYEAAAIHLTRTHGGARQQA